MRAGARGYQLKGAAQAETLRAIRSVANGEAILGPAIATRLQRYLTATPTADPGDAFPQLTELEHEVLGLLAEGRDNAAVARRLGVSSKTVRNHVSNIIAKLHVADRSGAIIRARDAGMGGAAGST